MKINLIFSLNLIIILAITFFILKLSNASSDYGDFNPAPVLQKPKPGPIVDPGRK